MTMPNAFRWLRKYFALLVIAAAFIWSAATIFMRQNPEASPGITVLRIGHWQLETGMRDAFEQMAADYHELHPDVVVLQEAVPVSIYPTWLNTNLVGGSAPDILEIPNEGHIPDDILIQYYNRYFLILSPYVSQANPYNKGTKLEGLPLRRTYRDGMRAAYAEELQEYMSIPLSLFSARIFYNKNLLKKLTGSSEAPSGYREFLAACAKIKSQKDERGKYYVPIAAAKESMWAWDSMMFDPITYPALRRTDFSRDGTVSDDEMYTAFKTGRINFQFPAFKARYKITREITEYFPEGFTGLTLDDTVFSFAQQRSVFLSTGTWDARSLQSQADHNFEIGVMDFPLPGKDDPEYGAFIEGPKYEEIKGGLPFGITRSSKHKEIALDFLFFMVGQKQNEALNKKMGLMPVIEGAETDPFFAAFAPHLEGVYAVMHIDIGGETRNKFEQLYPLYLCGKISYETFVAEFEPFYINQGLKDWQEKERDWRRALLMNEQLLGGMRAAALISNWTNAGDAESKWVKYRAMTRARQVMPEIDHNRKVQLIEKGPAPNSTGPYEYSDEVLKKIRARVKEESMPVKK